MKFKPNHLSFCGQTLRDYDAYIFPLTIEYPGKKKGMVIHISVTLRELKEGRVTLDTLQAKLSAVASALRSVMFEGNIKGRKQLIKELQKSLKRN